MNSNSQPSFTLALSSGFFGFYAHVGFMKALEELGLEPSAYSGTSAGAIVAAASAREMTVKEIEKLVVGISRKEFWDPTVGFGFLRGRKMQELIAREIGSEFSDLKKPLRISVFDLMSRSTTVLTSGNLARAIRATCAVPLMFHPVRLNRRLYLDGGVLDKMGIHGIDANEKILSHYLESTGGDPHSVYERKRDIQTVESRNGVLIQIQHKGLMKANPFALDRGPDIIRASYERTMAELKPLVLKGLWA